MAISVAPEWPERNGRQRKYIGDSLVINIRISRIPSTLPERLLKVGFGFLKLVNAYVGLQSICINLYLNNRLPFLEIYQQEATLPTHPAHIGLMHSDAGFQSICKNFCLNIRRPVFRNLLTEAYRTLHFIHCRGVLCMPV
jgi:hypothetical protein